MVGLERAEEWLRPFVDSKEWDYCVVWKLGDDPSSFIEWLGCCCSGGIVGCVKLEKGEDEYQLARICRDEYYKHPVSSKACDSLAELPFLIALYSGIHGEVVISNQPRWLSRASAPDSDNPLELIGTQVLIPVSGGLVELFTAKNVAKDQMIIDMITAHFCSPIKQEAKVENHYSYASQDDQKRLDALLEENFPPSSHLLNFISRMQIVPSLAQAYAHPSSEGSSSISNSSHEHHQHQSFDSYSGYLSQTGHLNQPIASSSSPRDFFHDESFLKQQAAFFTDCNKKVAKATTQKPERDKCKSKNLVAERNRRNRINDGILTLRSLVPKISKMDKASVFGDAIDYIKELQDKVRDLQNELKEIEEEEDRQKSNLELKPSSFQAFDEGSKQKRTQQMHLEVNLIGERHFLIEFLCEHKRGGFNKLIDSIDSLGLEVVDVNVTTHDGQILNILKAEAKRMNIQPEKLRDSLLQLIV